MRITIKIENKYIGWLYVSYTLLKMIFETKKVCTLGGARTHDHKIKSLALYHLSYEGSWCLKRFSVCFIEYISLKCGTPLGCITFNSTTSTSCLDGRVV